MTNAPFMLSVSGARGIVGRTMTPLVAKKLALSWAFILYEELGYIPELVLGRDSRPSGDSLLRAASEALLGAGFSVCDLGLVSTPTVGYAIEELKADGGIVITASHNPKEWNGMKILNRFGTAPPSNTARKFIKRFESSSELSRVGNNKKSKIKKIDDITCGHVQKVLSIVNCELIKKRKFKIGVDSINGAGCEGVKLLSDFLDFNLNHINNTPDGNFSHSPEPKPENLGQLSNLLRNKRMDIGFAQDPDADRLVLVDEKGIPISEEYTLALCVWSWLKRNKTSAICTNLSTSRLVDSIASKFNTKVKRYPVGEANVAEAMRAIGSTIGGEGNGGVILPSVTWVRDSLSAMALVLELMASENKKISDLVISLPCFTMVKKTYSLEEFGDQSGLNKLIDLLVKKNDFISIDRRDGLRVDYSYGWVHLRTSNTEPIVRMIIEADSKANVEVIKRKVNECMIL